MFCIIVFLIFLILFPIFGIFSKDYRGLFKKSWSCAFKKLTLKPCDINFGDEIKNKLLGKIIFKYPRLAKFIDKTATLWSILFVILSLWSLLYVVNAGLNLWVYDTCDPTNGESCSLSGEACSVNQTTAPTIFETLSRIPDRLKNWSANEYISENSSFYNEVDSKKQTAIEVIDPGCKFCKKLWGNIKQADFVNSYNLTYIAYPIPEGEGYKFQHSYLIVSYLEALKLRPISDSPIPTDWRLLDKIFTENVEGIGVDLQTAINLMYTKDEVIELINKYISEFGYTDNQIQEINQLVNSSEVRGILANNKVIVEDQIKTIKIPTIIFDGRRYDRVVDVETLRE